MITLTPTHTKHRTLSIFARLGLFIALLLAAFPAQIAHTQAPTACLGWVTVDEVTLYEHPHTEAFPLATAPLGEQLTIELTLTDAQQWRWARTPRGWFALDTPEMRTVELSNTPECQTALVERPTALPGLHLLNWMGRDAALTYVQRMVDAGYPVSTVKGLNGTENILNTIKQISPSTVTVYRSLHNPDGFGDCPADIESDPDPAKTAERWIDGLAEYWDEVDADYYELMNECPGTLWWQVRFSVAAMEIANTRGYCLLVLSPNVGTPDADDFHLLKMIFEYALAFPCESGRLHGLALHAYTLDDTVMLSQADSSLTQRHVQIYSALRPEIPEIDRVPVYLTEAGVGWGNVVPDCGELARDLVRFSRQLQAAPYVQGFHLWNIGPDTMQFDVSPCLPAVADAVIHFYATGEVP